MSKQRNRVVQLYHSHLRDQMDKKGGKEISDYEAEYPEHFKLTQDDPDMRLRLEQLAYVSEFHLYHYCVDEIPGRVKTFFTQSATHRVLFYILAANASRQLLKSKEETNNQASIGVAVPKVLAAMCLAENLSMRRCQQYITDAVNDGYVNRTYWRYDKRKQMLWLSPHVLNTYITDELPSIDALVTNLGVHDFREEIRNKNRDTPGWVSDLKLKILRAMGSRK